MKASLNLFDVIFQQATENPARLFHWMLSGSADTASANDQPVPPQEPAPSKMPVSPAEQALWRSAADGMASGPFHAPGSIFR